MIRQEEHGRALILDPLPWKHEAIPEVPIRVAPGIRVLSTSEVAARYGKSKKQVTRLERSGALPRRRRISRRLTGYFQHELEGLDAASVVVRDPRTIGREQVARKLSVHEKTVTRWVRDGVLPPPEGGRWQEQVIDVWLLNRPFV